MSIAPNIAISIGGSGARCAEALIYLCAAGLGPDELSLLFVDADQSNASLEKAIELAKLYQKLQSEETDHAKASNLFKTRIHLLSEQAWSPFTAGSQQTLEKHFQYDVMKDRDPEAARLMEALFEKGQRSASLEVGFRGKPSIGAAVFADTIDPVNEPWASLISDVTNHVSSSDVRLFAFGSLFGGTGAAGLPTIPRRIRERVTQGRDRIHLGAALLLPYFSFTVPGAPDDPIYASPDLFTLNSKEALRYYAGLGSEYQLLYVLGSPKPGTKNSFALGGKDQKNLPHFVELCGALGSLDFFHRSCDGPSQMAILGIEKHGAFSWVDLPQDNVQSRMGDLARASYFYCSTVYPRILAIKDGSRASLRRTPWYQHLVQRRGDRLQDDATLRSLEGMRSFFERFLRWMRDLERNDGEIDLQLFNTASFGGNATGEDLSLKVADYDGDIVYQGKAGRIGLSSSWSRLCEQESWFGAVRKIDSRRAFQAALYDAVSSDGSH